MDARGLALDETLGHAGTPISVISGYEPLTGLADSRTVQVGAASRQQLTFDWNLTGNLKQRRDVNQANRYGNL